MKKCIFIGLFAEVACTCGLWAASFDNLSLDQMESALADAHLSRDVYDNNAEVRDGYLPNDGFLGSSMINKGFTTADGRTVFRFNSGNAELDSYLYSYNPANGMITPYEGDPYRDFMNGIFPKDYSGDPKPPDFVAQVTVKDGITQIAFRGTQTASDWRENTEQFFGNVPAQYELADCLVQAVQETSGRPVHVTGHSEGGGESQYVVLRSIERGSNNITGTGFNAQRLSEEVLGSFSRETRETAGNLMTQFRVENDVVSGWEFLGEDLIGTTYEYDPVCWIGDYFCVAPLTAHAMDTVIDRIEAAIAAKQRENAPAGESGEDSEKDPFDSDPENKVDRQPQAPSIIGGGSSGGGTSGGGRRPQPTTRHRGGSGGGDTKAKLFP